MSEITSLNDVIIPLRRYGRAVCGTTEVADELLADSLEAMASSTADHRDFDSAFWFSLFDKRLHHWAEANDHPPSANAPRRAFLLFAMENFSVEDVARILDVDTKDAATLIAEAENGLKSMLTTKVMIIEDEPMIAGMLGRAVRELNHELVGHATNATQAIDIARRERPGLILSDVRLANESSGIDATEEIRTFLPDAIIIFITAYPESFLSGEVGEPEFLIPKPFRPQYVQATISQALLAARGAA